MQEFTIVIEQDEAEYFVGEVVELPGCFTQAKTRKELTSRMREAIELYLEVQGEKPGKHLFVDIEKVRI